MTMNLSELRMRLAMPALSKDAPDCETMVLIPDGTLLRINDVYWSQLETGDGIVIIETASPAPPKRSLRGAFVVA